MGDDELKEKNRLNKDYLSSSGTIALIQQLHRVLDLEVIRLTGGEPLLYPHLAEVIGAVKEMGIPEIKMTTNGFLLERSAQSLKEAGLQSINVSLDAVDEDVFFLMSKRNNVQRILNGIDAALNAGLRVKLNTVLMKGINETQVIPLLEYAFERNIPIRFLELMNMGHLYQQASNYLITKEEVLHTIARHYDFVPMLRKQSATANYWKTTDGNLFGIIANESAPFCHDCNRLRLDNKGNIYGCLSSNHPINIVDCNEQELQQKLMQALHQKQTLKFTGSQLSMLQIGG
jgi:cyclic pyranopterin phosphate synthase